MIFPEDPVKKLSLDNIHKSHGARFVEYAGWDIPADYGDAVEEHLSVRKNAGLIDLSYKGKLMMTGQACVKFLQGLVTNDVANLGEGKGTYAAILEVKGKILADMEIYSQQEGFLICVEPENRDKTFQLLNKYKIGSAVTIDDVTESIGLLSVHGPKVLQILSQALYLTIPPLTENSFCRGEFEGRWLIIARTGSTGEEGYHLFHPVEGLPALWEVLWKAGEDCELAPFGLEALESLRIEAGIPRYGRDFDETVLPQEASIEKRAVSWTKGCYVGQEPVSRVYHRGRVNKRLVGLLLSGEEVPRKGDALSTKDQSEAGHITSSVFSPSLKRVIALGYVKKDYWEPGTALSALVNGAHQDAVVVELPFIHNPR